MTQATPQSQALIATRTQELFDRVPWVLGFSFDESLSAVEVELARWPGCAWSAEVQAEVEDLITELAQDLAAEDPAGAEALRGRTFALSLQ